MQQACPGVTQQVWVIDQVSSGTLCLCAVLFLHPDILVSFCWCLSLAVWIILPLTQHRCYRVRLESEFNYETRLVFEEHVWCVFLQFPNFLPNQIAFKRSQAKREDICGKWIFSEFLAPYCSDLKVKPHDGSAVNKEDQTRPAFQVIKQC